MLKQVKLSLICASILAVSCAHDASDPQHAGRNDSKQHNEVPVLVAPPAQTGRTDNRPIELEATTVVEDQTISREESRARNYSVAEREQAPASMASKIAQGAMIAPHPYPHPPQYPDIHYGPETNTENYRQRDTNPVKLVSESPVSTFSIDVDTGSYANARRFLRNGGMPPPDAIRTEEFINYFGYDYPETRSSEQPFSLYTEVGPSPWSPGKHLLHVGLRGFDMAPGNLPASNLVFLVDVSGSMNQPNKLPLLKTSLQLLTKQLGKEDKVSIVVYAGAAGVVLEPTDGNDTHRISTALQQLRAGGSTNGAAGIHLAYSMAQSAFIEGGINRVVLATDGDFNVGTTSIDELKQLVESKRKSGISLTTLGFGRGNYNDALMNDLAEIGDGNAAYIDTALEARKVLVDEVSATLFTIARDVKIQIEFSPRVHEYRLIGYESRMLKREDFNNDAKDAGEIGAGHRVTALYEITLADSDAKSIDDLRYKRTKTLQRKQSLHADEIAFLRLRYKLPDEKTSRLIEQPLYAKNIHDSLRSTSDAYRFSAAVAAFAEKLRRTTYLEDYRYADILSLAKGAVGKDTFGYRNEFVTLAKTADTIELAQVSSPRPERERKLLH